MEDTCYGAPKCTIVPRLSGPGLGQEASWPLPVPAPGHWEHLGEHEPFFGSLKSLPGPLTWLSVKHCIWEHNSWVERGHFWMKKTLFFLLKSQKKVNGMWCLVPSGSWTAHCPLWNHLLIKWCSEVFLSLFFRADIFFPKLQRKKKRFWLPQCLSPGDFGDVCIIY